MCKVPEMREESIYWLLELGRRRSSIGGVGGGGGEAVA